MNKPRIVDIARCNDARGTLWKPDFSTILGNSGALVRDSYTTYSKKNTLRGPHYQIAPFHQSKVYLLLHGRLRVYCFEIRNGEPSEQVLQFELGVREALYVPGDWATGTFAMEDSYYSAFMDNEYSPDNEVALGYAAMKPFLDARAVIVSEKDSL